MTNNSSITTDDAFIDGIAAMQPEDQRAALIDVVLDAASWQPTQDAGRCFDCGDHGHLTTEHCWHDGDICRCGETPLWAVTPRNACAMAAEGWAR